MSCEREEREGKENDLGKIDVLVGSRSKRNKGGK